MYLRKLNKFSLIKSNEINKSFLCKKSLFILKTEIEIQNSSDIGIKRDFNTNSFVIVNISENFMYIRCQFEELNGYRKKNESL